ncbi:BrnA antitoxin family protein [Methylobacterium durans]|uniref:BrnA antitoxin family protein n=1 Tax=Methylobacterium durans TaxID=2202825 RepID=A0A2U8W5K4_9HYPH|nr:BrnA antitoxin family protein [Methylobacterium durans]AWN40632.1 hypothetical protein DK389_08950 [Methylobacterium durans]
MIERDRLPPTLIDTEEAALRAGIASDPDNPEWIEGDFRRARPVADVFPDRAARLRKTQDAPIQQRVGLAIDRDVLDRFRATGPDWKKRMNAIPHEAAEDLPTA